MGDSQHENPRNVEIYDLEWTQSWEHYRHLENQRSRYLGFYFSILIASIGIIASFYKDMESSDFNALFLSTFLLLVVVLFLSINIYVSIKKTGYVLDRYLAIINYVRSEKGLVSSEEFPTQINHFKEYPKYMKNNKDFSIQDSAVRMIVFLMFCLAISLVSMIYYAFFESPDSFFVWQKLTFLGASVFPIYRFLVVILQVERPKQAGR